MRAHSLKATSDRRVLVFPALTPGVSGKQVHFLFSVLQVVDIIQELAVHPIPFSPPFLEGIAEWRERVLPVLSLEQCLGLPTTGRQQAQRLVVVQIGEDQAHHSKRLQGVFRVAPAIHMLSLPIPCTPASNGWIPQESLVRGIYEWDEGLLVVVHLENILSGEMRIDRQKMQSA